ncbi:hypothetical protein ACMATS_05860 [Streptoverticillium reticulum]|uniref:hypothetical protein n=1 Tax=Streptoverticillium reticulum TaxID=1433415 RepID=UPI0039BF9F2D
MHHRPIVATAAACLVLLSACASPHQTSGSDSAPKAAAAALPHDAVLPVGPGPQAHYAVQPQPAAGTCHYRHTPSGEPLPDVTCTPGATNPKVTPGTIASTICAPGGYTGKIRPPVNVTNVEKKGNARSYGFTGPLGDAEYDHLISLQLGGDPNDPRNLWVEPPDPGHKPGAGPNNNKDKVETALHTAICKHKTGLVQAQRAIAEDWTTALTRLGLAR